MEYAAAQHNVKPCTCHRGDIGRKKIKEANKTKRSFYKTEKGLAKMYKEKMELKKSPLGQLSTRNVRKNVKKLFHIGKSVKMM